MTALLLIGIVLVAAAAALGVRVATMAGAQGTRGAVARAGAYGYPAGETLEGLPRRRRLQYLTERAVASLGRRLQRRLLGGTEEELRALLRGAGFAKAAPGSYVVVRLLVVLLAAAVGVALLTGSLPKAVALLAAVFLVVEAWLLPKVELKRRRAARLRRVDRGLTDLVEFLVVTVEAGIGFGSALNIAATRFRAPLGDELRLTVQEQSMGLSVEEALHNLLTRCDTPMMRSFVRAVLQAESLGVSVGQILRGLALEMRRRRRQAAEEQAHKASVKIVFPLAFLILPAMMIIVVGPAIRSMLHTFGP